MSQETQRQTVEEPQSRPDTARPQSPGFAMLRRYAALAAAGAVALTGSPARAAAAPSAPAPEASAAPAGSDEPAKSDADKALDDLAKNPLPDAPDYSDKIETTPPATKTFTIIPYPLRGADKGGLGKDEVWTPKGKGQLPKVSLEASNEQWGSVVMVTCAFEVTVVDDKIIVKANLCGAPKGNVLNFVGEAALNPNAVPMIKDGKMAVAIFPTLVSKDGNHTYAAATPVEIFLNTDGKPSELITPPMKFELLPVDPKASSKKKSK